MSKRMRPVSTVLGIFCAYLYLFAQPQKVSAAVAAGLTLCAGTIVPSLFPYFVLTGVFLRMGCAELLGSRVHRLMFRLFRVNGTGAAALLLGAVGGYPLGASAVSDLYRRALISRSEADKLLSFCCNAGPGFIFGVIGGALYKSFAVGSALFLVHIAASLLCGLLPLSTAVRTVPPPQRIQKRMPFPLALVEAVTDSGTSLVRVCTFITFFSVILSILQLLPGSDSLPGAVLSGIAELSAGCAALAKLQLNWNLKFALTAVFVSFGGVCVLLQTMSVLSAAGLSAHPYLCGKVLHGLFSGLLAYPVSFLISSPAAVSGVIVDLRPFSPFPLPFFIFCFLLLIFLEFPSSNSARCSL